jgi:hypothetical protein
MFPTFDPPPIKEKDAIGHWVTVCLNLKTQCFQYLDSLFGVEDQAGWDIFNQMVKHIRILWSDCSIDMEIPPTPPSLDTFATHYMGVPKQDNGLVCLPLAP